LSSGKDGFAVKKLLAFVMLMTFVSVLTVSTVGCGKKTATSGTVAVPTTATITTKAESK